MKITVVCSTSKKDLSTTYNLAKQVAEKLCGNDKPNYFFLPKDFSHFCCSCMQCFSDHEEKCPGFADLKVIRDSMNSSQLIIFAVPVFVYHVPGQLKTFLDHFGWEWMVHKPNELMFKKQALIISTAAGAGMKSAVKDVKDSLDYWGIGKVYTYKKAVRAANWSGILVEKQVKMLASMDRIANRITNGSKNSTPRIKVKLMFLAFRAMHKHIHFSPSDVAYWKEKGWLGKNRPWKK